MTKNKPPVVGQSVRASTFTLGRRAFAKVSAVEGIQISKALASELDELQHADGSRRRAALADKYGRS
jgi:hypothetical protein